VSVWRRLWVLSRPRLAPYVLALVLAGYGWAHWDRALTMRGGAGLPWVLVGWWFLHAGTLWLNAAVDRDEGEVLMGEAVEPPEGIELWGYAALVAAVASSGMGGPIAGGGALICALLAVAYSHPALLWKGHPLGGPLVNGLGYGLLSPMVGWSLVGVPLNPRTAVAWVLGFIGILGCYFAAQVFQEREDSERGYRTMVVVLGASSTLLVARVAVAVTLWGAVALAILGWIPRGCLALAPAALWVDRWFAAWARLPDGGDESAAREMARRLLISAFIGVLAATVVYLDDSFHGRPVAGLSTAAGLPTDRPRLPPGALRAWEQHQGPVTAHEEAAR